MATKNVTRKRSGKKRGTLKVKGAPLPLSVLIITYNEEVNLPHALANVCGWADQVVVVDSYSTDRTCEIAARHSAEVHQHTFVTYADQRNWALRETGLRNDWVLLLDADEYLSPDLKAEIGEVIVETQREVAAFLVRRKFFFLGRWIKHGDVFPALMRVVRKDKVSYVTTTGFREKLVAQGEVRRLKYCIVHDDKKNLLEWTAKQGERAYIDALEKFAGPVGAEETAVEPTDAAVEESTKVWLRKNIFFRLPRRTRPFAQFAFRYFGRLGFLDGWSGFIYHFLLQFWYPLLVEGLYEELRYRNTGKTGEQL